MTRRRLETRVYAFRFRGRIRYEKLSDSGDDHRALSLLTIKPVKNERLSSREVITLDQSFPPVLYFRESRNGSFSSHSPVNHRCPDTFHRILFQFFFPFPSSKWTIRRLPFFPPLLLNEISSSRDEKRKREQERTRSLPRYRIV